MNKLDNIFQTLNIDTTNGLYYTKGTTWKVDLQLSSRVGRCLEQINPDAFFCFDNKPLILFFENPKIEDLHKKIWNINEVPVIITVNNASVEIFNGFNLLADKNTLEKLCSDDKLTDFSYFKLVTGETWKIYEKELNYQNRVDYKLLDNISVAREQILKQFPTISNNEKTKKQYVKITNALLGKIIFVRYLIDRKVELNFEDQAKIWKNDDLCKLLENPTKVVEFFEYLADKEKGFNGDLFPLAQSEYEIIPQEAYNILIKLLKSQEIATGQQSLFDLYDFSIIPTEFISNVYEYFIGADNRSKQGTYYTPLFLVDYILTETIGKYIIENQTYNCKILDPACGSGVFLVETLRKLIEQYKLSPANDIEQYKKDIKDIAVTNIFGVDKDESAVQVAIFSIYLTLLDYMNPPEIKSFKFPNLMGTNFFSKDFFDENADFNTVLKNNDFAFIVGNPPWFRGKNETEKPMYVKYIEERKKKEKQQEIQIEIGNKEIAQAFLLRSSDFSSTNTKCALISTSKVLYNLQSKNFRKYFLHNYLIEKVFELAPVRREVFHDEAIAPACVLFFSYAHGKNTDTNLIEHIALKPSRFFSMFKIFSIYRHDIQIVQQDRLKQYDWLWKVLVYGSYLDFNFIKRLKEDLDTIKSIIDKKQIIFKQGLKRKDGDKQIQVPELKGKLFLDTQKKQLQPFMIIDSEQKWNVENVGYIYKQNDKPYIDLFQPYSLLIAGGIFKDLTSNAAINKQNRVFTSSIRVLKIKDESQLDILYSINSILCSSLFSYYMLNLGVSAGIEREESEDTEIENMWYFNIQNVIENAKKIEEYQKNKNTLSNRAIEEISIKQQCDNIVLPQLNLNTEERSLLDYANNITIPIQMRHKNYEKLSLPLKLNDAMLADYANLFIERFASNFEKTGKKFVVEIWHTKQIVGMFFKVISQAEYNNMPIVWKDKQQDTSGIFKKIIELGATKITDQLFVQKDIRGFEKESFYIFKPNEKRLWHKAVGYLDINEFEEAILKAGRVKNG